LPHEFSRGLELVWPGTKSGWHGRRMARDDDGRRKGRKRAAIIGLIVLPRFMHLPAYAVIAVCRSPGRRLEKIHPHRHVGDHIPGVGLDAVAGHRIRDAGVLRGGPISI